MRHACMPSKSGGLFTSVQTKWVEIPNILLCILALGWLWGMYIMMMIVLGPLLITTLVSLLPFMRLMSSISEISVCRED